MRSIVFASALALGTQVAGQTYTLSGCHLHNSVEYCFLPDGSETPWTTYSESASPSTSVPPSTTVTEAPSTTSSEETSTATTTSRPANPSATGCHSHDESTKFCFVGSEEYQVVSEAEPSTAPDEYTECHWHDTELHCSDEGQDASLEPGVPHCVDSQGRTVDMGCSRPNNDYDVPLRIGLIFVILATSFIGVVLPIFTSKFTGLSMDHIVLLIIRQFGTGIIISTAFVHLFTHASLLFNNDCLTGVNYEATTAAILIAGLFVAFVAEYLVHRLVGGNGGHHNHGVAPRSSAAGHSHKGEAEDGVDTTRANSPSSSDEEALNPADKPSSRELTSSVLVMECGIIFHSILIGITLVVAGSSSFITLFIVILFHQMFEGIALGSRIALLPSHMLHKLLLAGGFAITTPIGMAIGTGVLSQFNGNDPSTIVAIGTLDAFSAGILLWVGVVEMLFHDWWLGPLAKVGVVKAGLAMVGLMAGLALMSLLGKWA
ncbi:Zip-domain-containing protein [Hortaea werneckii]|nr:Zip-domain-containing protein [Hortaea werneckii]KAI6880205.1 Zip-domain-containing protein [Hortaea werneckii]KAI6988467.1 Zip-domain-containing protein [Hortaea werneckii]KAI7142244.1 Zip-domain-containing protein [Hortaea werneckii]KAI7169524.1 Zip-domain-containing protein [Hortaea werneckii]